MKIKKTPETIEELEGIWNVSDFSKAELPETKSVSSIGEFLFFVCSIGVCLLIGIALYSIFNKS